MKYSPSRRLIGLSLALTLAACSSGPVDPRAPLTQPRTAATVADMEQHTMVNGAILQIALDDWSRENGGFYPATTSERGAAGRTVIDHLPAQQLMINPFTLVHTSPADGAAAAPGEVGYQPIVQEGEVRGYNLTGRGHSEQIFDWVRLSGPGIGGGLPLEFTPVASDPELMTLRNAVATRQAVEKWSADNGGFYPESIAADNITNRSLIDYFPGGLIPLNYFTGVRTGLANGAAAAPGEVGYTVVVQDGLNVGYAVTAFGASQTIWEWFPLYLHE